MLTYALPPAFPADVLALPVGAEVPTLALLLDHSLLLLLRLLRLRRLVVKRRRDIGG
jgi:hypothetical protein